MAYAIIMKTQARRGLKRLQRRDQERLKSRIDDLASNPGPDGVERFRRAENAYRIRVGDFRIVYQVSDAECVVYVVLIGDRKDVYKPR